MLSMAVDLDTIESLYKQAFTPFQESQLPPLLFSPDGQPFMVNPETNQVEPATPEILQQMGVPPEEIEAIMSGGAAPAPQPVGGPPMPPAGPAGPAGAPPQEGGQAMPSMEELVQVIMQLDQRVGDLEGAMQQIAQMTSDPAPQQMPPQPTGQPQPM
jgi:hypothetical protein